MIADAPASEEPRHVRGSSFSGGGAGSTPRARWTSSPTDWILGIGLGLLYLAAILALRHRGKFTDEVEHFSQIHLFLRGDPRILTDHLTMIPGYHALVAAVLWTFGSESLDAARLVDVGFAIVAAAGFQSLRRALWPGTESIATAQLLVLPIFAPFFFLVYTDTLALALLIWATLFCVREQHWRAAAALTALVCVRQHEVLWAAFLAVLAAWPSWNEAGFGAWRAIVQRAFPYALPMIGFLGFWAWNGAISLSATQSAAHPDLSLHLGNVLFAIVAAGGLLPLHVLLGTRDFLAASRRRAWVLALPATVFLCFWFGFHADHPFNAMSPSYYLHNGLVMAIEGHAAVRAAVGVCAALAVCGLAFTPLRPAAAVWMYPFAAVFLAASWLIEARYASVPIVLWLAFRQQRSRAIEIATFALWLALAVCIFYGIIVGRLFP